MLGGRLAKHALGRWSQNPEVVIRHVVAVLKITYYSALHADAFHDFLQTVLFWVLPAPCDSL